ncbi:MAG: ATP citrate lyase citrate-binding domain-containing protein [Candidatus Bipolaricaulis sp.]|nr:ATP citrate lyase citrate-binding domain-containing protein [Candidatus Bipolaricaulis sp.]MDY0392546.1 ATP citrate lyase citrate-binding domain-containing protein [Candidatus Bipolaricaulis sp.]
MAQRGIREYDAKRMLARAIGEYSGGKFRIDDRLVLVTPETDLATVEADHPWLAKERLVVKPDQLFGKRGKNKLILLNADLAAAKAWIAARMGKEVTIEGAGGTTTGILTHFLIEPFVPHDAEYYLAFTSSRDVDTIHFSPKGGVDIESVWDTVVSIDVPVLADQMQVRVLPELPDIPHRETVAEFIQVLYRIYVDYHFTYLEFNPLAFFRGRLIPLDTVAKLDDTAAFQCAEKWGEITFPRPFGKAMTKEEAYVESLDAKTGASLKLTLLNPDGRVWLLVAGGGASVIYADTVVDLGFGGELANYGEYSGDPSTELTYEYTKTLLDLMTRVPDPQGRPKYLLIGGGIANFTDVAKTFTGIIQALEEYKDRLQKNHVKIYVRRGGPNYKEGLENMRRLGERIGVPLEVYGPETHMTRIVSLALEEAQR